MFLHCWAFHLLPYHPQVWQLNQSPWSQQAESLLSAGGNWLTDLQIDAKLPVHLPLKAASFTRWQTASDTFHCLAWEGSWWCPLVNKSFSNSPVSTENLTSQCGLLSEAVGFFNIQARRLYTSEGKQIPLNQPSWHLKAGEILLPLALIAESHSSAASLTCQAPMLASLLCGCAAELCWLLQGWAAHC